MSAPAVLGVTAAALVVGLPVIIAADAVAGGARASAAADAAALAAADAVLGWTLSERDPCELAGEVASAHRGVVTQCEVAPGLGEARVSVTVSGPLWSTTRSARAAPQDN